MTFTSDRITPTKPCLWEERFVIENLPPWIYTDNQQPSSLKECEAKISSLEYTLRDIDLQIDIRELELRTGNSRHQSSFDYEKWKVQALKAKQTQYYLLNAYKFWYIKNKRESYAEDNQSTKETLNSLIKLLIEDPHDFEEKATSLLIL